MTLDRLCPLPDRYYLWFESQTIIFLNLFSKYIHVNNIQMITHNIKPAEIVHLQCVTITCIDNSA